ncbi:hypothetical protein [Plantactinospora endophytica]|uniref:Uncharacterized protein n=1 Tax=Plantactinospora endophytica TaxID=673535 RepID=A0ABQ4DW03_9ACTN|nr:hypothetical protein [Plantactinospora endophytica]GIG86634.1 hypothetical protein Pen02_15700 [Plantactinospora endophytica]
MDTRRELSDLIRAMARRDWERADSLLEQLDQVGWSGGSQVIGAAFALAVDRRFRGKDLQYVAEFVRETRSRYQDGSDLPALAMEGMIRAVLGETHLVDDIAPDVAFSVQIAILGTLLQDENLDDPQLELFIRQVEQTAAEYM